MLRQFIQKIIQKNFSRFIVEAPIFFSFILYFCLSPRCLSLEIPKEEHRTIKECEQKLCSTILAKKNGTENLECILSKTWDRDTIKKGETGSVQWGFGDARCSVYLNIKNQDILDSLTNKEYIAKIPPHEISCLIELSGEEKSFNVKAAPKLIFKDGRVEKIWINLSDMRGPSTITSAIWLAAELEDKFGIFHKKMIKSVNKFIFEKCPKNYNTDGSPKIEALTKTFSKKTK